MAVMATPEPQVAASDQRVFESGLDREGKAGTNGHKSPSALPAKFESAPEPRVNGDGRHAEAVLANGVAATKDVAPNTNIDAFTSNQNISAKPQEPSPTPQSDEDEDEVVLTEVPSTEKDADVEMTGTAAESANVGSNLDAPDAPSVPTARDVDPPAVESLKPVELSVEDRDAADRQAPASQTTNGLGSSSAPTEEPPTASGPNLDLGPASMSQLAIDKEEESIALTPAPTPPTQLTDVPMHDAPPATKIARGREDDSADEPAPKRVRTESQEEEEATTLDARGEVKAEVTGDQADVVMGEPADTKDGSALDKIERWADKELDSQPITLYQAREYRRILAGLKKTKNGAHFRDSVQKLWPQIYEAYVLKVDRPTDLGELERTLRDKPWATLGEFKENLGLLHTNAVKFNGPEHEITLAGLSVVEQAWTRCLAIPPEEPPKQKAAPKHMPSRHHEQRSSGPQAPQPTPQAQAQPPAAAQPKPKPATTRRASSSAATSPTEKPPEAQAFAIPPGGVPQIRRASTQTEGDRPKRAIHPPKSKDIDYGTAPQKKNLKPELQFCDKVLQELMDEKHLAINGAFMHPVDPVALGIPTYFKVIKKAMDLSTLKTQLYAGDYTTAKQFQNDMELMFKNCYKFNESGTPVFAQGKELEALFQQEWAKKDQWLAKNTPAKAASASASDIPSDEESEEEEEAAKPGSSEEVAQLNRTISQLQDKLQEETANLNKLYLDANPNEVMINLQTSLLSTVQQSLLAEKQKLAALKSEKPPSKPKASKPAKSKAASAAGGGKKAGGAAAGPKKAGGGGKKAAKKTITEGDKSLIANAINNLDYPHIEDAITIIKKDTGQAENNNGELELDIDQLSNDALLKLWELCKKALPNFGGRDKPAPESSPSVNSGAAKQAPKPPKPKKNKPMNAQEQEERISKLRGIRDQFRGGSQAGLSPEAAPDGGASQAANTPAHMSSDDSDSEED